MYVKVKSATDQWPNTLTI